MDLDLHNSEKNFFQCFTNFFECSAMCMVEIMDKRNGETCHLKKNTIFFLGGGEICEKNIFFENGFSEYIG